LWIDGELGKLMGCKMIKGNGLALLILIFIFTLVPVSCDNNSSINSTQLNSDGNAKELYPPILDNISETKEIIPNLESSEKITSIIKKYTRNRSDLGFDGK
jgi:hypothetical protein